MIIFLYGHDSFRARQKLKELRKKFKRDVDPSGANLEVLDGAEIDMGQINAKVAPASLLVKKRMVVINDIFSNKNKMIFAELLKYFQGKKDNENIIIFLDSGIGSKLAGRKKSIVKLDASGREKALLVGEQKFFKFLSSQKYAQEFKPLSNLELVSWIKKEAKARDGKISNQAAQSIAALLGNDLWQVDAEISKLISYKFGLRPRLAVGGKPTIIEVGDVEKLVRGKLDENIFALTDAISTKNKPLAMKLLEDQYEAGMVDAYILTMIIRQFKILLQIRQALDMGNTSRKIISALKLHPFVVQKGINQVRNFNLENLKIILNFLVQVDFKIKIGQGDVRTELDLLLAKI